MANIKIDCSDTSVVLVCESCNGAWRAFAWSKTEAHEAARAHELRSHPGELDAYEAQRQFHRRGGRPSRLETRR